MRQVALILITIVGVCVVAPLAMADLTVNGTGYGKTNSLGQRGGEFRVTVQGPVLDQVTGQMVTLARDFRTFCIERGETLKYGVPYEIELSSAAKYNNQAPSYTNPLSGKTAFLYDAYCSGTIVVKSNSDAAALQNAIWYIEGQLGTDKYLGFKYDSTVRAKIDYFLGLVANVAENGPIGRVRVINMWTGTHDYCHRAQDLLACVETVVPAPGAVFLACLGLGMVGWLKRRLA